VIPKNFVKIFPVALLGLFICFSVNLAQSKNSTSPHFNEKVFQYPLKDPPKNRSFLSVAKNLQKTPLIRGSFSQKKTLKGFKKALKASGIFIYSKKEGIYWQLQKPITTAFVFTPQGGFHQKKGNNQTSSTSNPLERETIKIFLSIFSGNISQLNRNFALHFTPDTRDKNAWTIGLIPKEKSVKKYVHYFILKGKDHIQDVKILESNGDLTRLLFFELRKEPVELTQDERNKFLVRAP